MWGTEHALAARCGRIAWYAPAVVVLLGCTAAAAQTPSSHPRTGPAGPNLDALPQPLTRTPLDLEALARGYAAQSETGATAPGLHRGPGLIVFISLGTPRASLDRLLDQAARAGASVVLRGFVQGSLRATVAQVQDLIGPRALGVQIDPPAFDRFGITQVPSFVLVRDGARPTDCAAGHCAAASDYLKTAGDVSLDYALQHMVHAAPAFQDAAAPFLTLLQP